MPIVLDASITGAISLPDENTPTESVMASLSRDVLIVPAHWWMEVANLVQMAVRRNRLAVADRATTLEIAGSLPVATDYISLDYAWTRTIELAEDHGLTVYDAAYIEVALRRGARLASLDRRLMAAARSVGLTLIE